jgi:peptide/nickel transport system substrate-binding protein
MAMNKRAISKMIGAIIAIILVLVAGFAGYYFAYLPSTMPLVPNPGTVTEMTIGEPQTLDPGWNYESAGNAVLELVCEGLFTYDKSTTNIVPLLLDSGYGNGKGYTISSDGLVYTFKLRQGIKFSDGTPMDAKAYKYNFDRMVLMNNPQGYASLFYDVVKGVTRYISAETWGVTNQTEVSAYNAAQAVKVIDDLTFSITLEMPYAPFASMLGNYPKLLSPTWVDQNGGSKPGFGNEVIDRHPVGTGPFKVVEWVPKERIVLERNDAYWGTKATVQTIIVQYVDEFNTRNLAFLAGDADFIYVSAANAFDMIEKDPWLNQKNIVPLKPGYVFDVSPYLSNTAFQFNTKIKPMDNKDFRKGLQYAFNYDEYIKSVVNNFANQPYGPVPQALLSDTTIPRPGYDAAKATQFFAAAKSAGAFKDGDKLTVMYNAGNEGRRLGCLLLADSVNALKVGITISVQELDWPTYLAKVNARELPLYFIGWGADFADADNFIFTYGHSQGYYAARTGYKNAEVDSLIDQGRVETDMTKRAKLYHDASAKINDDAMYILASEGTQIVCRRDWITNWYTNPVRSGIYNYDIVKQERTNQVAILIGNGPLIAPIVASSLALVPRLRD